jgi:aldehyde dehydrogenase (NAD+)
MVEVGSQPLSGAAHANAVTEVVQSRSQFYVAGRWQASSGTGSIDVEDPTTEEVVARVPAANADDVDAAVSAARSAARNWAHTSPVERAEQLRRLGQALTAREERIANIIAIEVGSPLKMAKSIQAALPLTVIDSYVDLLGRFEFEERIGNSLVVREPVGVVAAITPWNYPLHQVVAKVAAALASGCTVVVKPSELAPLGVFELADAAEEAELPAGVFNLICGSGAVIGEMLVGHAGVDMVSFTGSTRAGTRVSTVAAPGVKKVALELGGKSANVILEDADLAKAVRFGVANAFLNAGQTCTAWTRMLVHESRYAEAVEIARQSAERYQWGDPFEETTRLGPVISKVQRESVWAHIRSGVAEGARLVSGGADAPKEPKRGYFVQPTVFADVLPSMKIAQEEIFGPVLAMTKFRTDDEAVSMANDSAYGLAGGVWSADAERALRVARAMESGQVDINGAAFNPVAPFGGYKRSGIGRELGQHGLEEFLQTKAIQL